MRDPSEIEVEIKRRLMNRCGHQLPKDTPIFAAVVEVLVDMLGEELSDVRDRLDRIERFMRERLM